MTRAELPDHLGVVLEALEHLAPDEREDLVRYCLAASIEKMRTELQRQANPYASAMSALERIVSRWCTNKEVPRD
jgi:nitrate reductase assembly molybdenum cofactor insertion protein NarJ